MSAVSNCTIIGLGLGMPLLFVISYGLCVCLISWSLNAPLISTTNVDVRARLCACVCTRFLVCVRVYLGVFLAVVAGLCVSLHVRKDISFPSRCFFCVCLCVYVLVCVCLCLCCLPCQWASLHLRSCFTMWSVVS